MIKLYRKIVPTSIRKKIYKSFIGDIVEYFKFFKFHMKGIYTLCFYKLLPSNEINKVYAFFGRHGISAFPYDYSLKYKNMHVEAGFDDAKDMPYVIHENKKLYLPKVLGSMFIDYYRGLLIENDCESSHRYVGSYDELKGKTLFDIGAAEGMFSLSVIDLVQEVYIFEYDEKWIGALEATFEPWKEKATIVKKYANNFSDNENITVDDFIRGKSIHHLFLKLDVEGAEQQVLNGALETINNIPTVDLAVCTYHHEKDAEEISQRFTEWGFSYIFTSGYLFFEKQLRKALIRGNKVN